MSVEFNKAQIEAINADNKKILISAGAGAGKSGTLTGRIVKLIEENKSKLLQMLVITFTRDAASSIKDKIRKALEENQKSEKYNANINDSIANLPVSHISTIHSFCADVVRQGASLLKIDTGFSIVDDSLREKYFREAVDRAIDEIAKKTYPKEKKSYFGAFKKAINAEQITDMCLSVYDVLMGIPRPMDYLEGVIGKITDTCNPWEKELFAYYKRFLLSRTTYIEDFTSLSVNPLLSPAFQDVCKKDIVILNELVKDVKSAVITDDLINAIQKASDSAVAIRKSGKMNDAETAVYEDFKELHGYLKNKPTTTNTKKYLQHALTILDKIKKCKKTDILKTQKQLTGLKMLLEEVHNQFTTIKMNTSVLDYSDLEQYAYVLLTEYSEIREYFQNKYKYIFVDECQDVSAVQHAIISALYSGENNIFYVGDIKQSIYRFRHADPMRFLDMRNQYSENAAANCRKIFFQSNYRSSPTIIEAVNTVFPNILDKEYTEISYEPGDYLIAEKTEIKKLPNEIVLINGDIPKDPGTGKQAVDPLEAQCVEIGKRIKEYINTGAKYKDIVILLRSAKDRGQKIVNFLSAMHIPAYFNGKTAFFDTPEISLLIDILKTINNDSLDLPLLATLRSRLFGFSDEDLANIRLAYNDKDHSFSDAFHLMAERNTTPLEKKCKIAAEKLCEWKKEALDVKSASEVIWLMMRSTGYYAQQSAFPDGELRQKNLDALYEKALVYEKQGNYKLSDFLTHVNDLKKAKSGSTDPVPLSDNDDFVRIMTIHSSKGLEFPIVFLMDLQRSIHHYDKFPYQINIESGDTGREPLGIYMPCFSYVNKYKTMHDTYGKDAFLARKNMMELAEETRMLYVGMTRAETRLIMIGMVKPDKTGKWYNKNKAARILETDSMLDMIMPSALNGTKIVKEGDVVDNSLWKVSLVKAEGINTTVQSVSTVALPLLNNDIDFDELWNKNKKDKTNLPAKTAVTYIKEDNFADCQQIGTFELGDEMEKPAFLTEKTDKPEGAELGTLIHKSMRNLQINKYYGNTEKAATIEILKKEIAENGCISDAQAKEIVAVSVDGISNFLISKTGQEICDPKRIVLREQEFVANVTIDGNTVLVQGVIDIMLKDDNGKWIILDYKTDYNTREEVLIEKHAKQINYYRKAIEKITKTEVAKMFIVAIRNGNLIEVPRIDVKYM